MDNKKAQKIITTRVAEHWEKYSKVLPEKAGEVQIKETKLSFYAGMAVMFQVMQSLANVEFDDDEELIFKMLSDHNKDLGDFLVSVIDEKAAEFNNE